MSRSFVKQETHSLGCSTKQYRLQCCVRIFTLCVDIGSLLNEKPRKSKSIEGFQVSTLSSVNFGIVRPAKVSTQWGGSFTQAPEKYLNVTRLQQREILDVIEMKEETYLRPHLDLSLKEAMSGVSKSSDLKPSL